MSSMVCPAWEDCNKKFCMENERCWKANHLVGITPEGMKMKASIVKESHNPCTKKEGVCDKNDTCEFLGQCIFTINAVKGNRKLIKALYGKHSMDQVLGILKRLNSKPMRSYYFCQKKK